MYAFLSTKCIIHIVNRFLLVPNVANRNSNIVWLYQFTVLVASIINIQYGNKCNHFLFYGKNSPDHFNVERCIHVCMVRNSAFSNILLYFSSFCYTARLVHMYLYLFKCILYTYTAYAVRQYAVSLIYLSVIMVPPQCTHIGSHRQNIYNTLIKSRSRSIFYVYMHKFIYNIHNICLTQEWVPSL